MVGKRVVSLDDYRRLKAERKRTEAAFTETGEHTPICEHCGSELREDTTVKLKDDLGTILICNNCSSSKYQKQACDECSNEVYNLYKIYLDKNKYVCEACLEKIILGGNKW